MTISLVRTIVLKRMKLTFVTSNMRICLYATVSFIVLLTFYICPPAKGVRTFPCVGEGPRKIRWLFETDIVRVRLLLSEVRHVHVDEVYRHKLDLVPPIAFTAKFCALRKNIPPRATHFDIRKKLNYLKIVEEEMLIVNVTLKG